MSSNTILLYSGAWHTWSHIAPVLPCFTALGYRVIGRPLLAAGSEHTTEETLQDIVSTIEREEPTHVILHSAAGLLGSEALNRTQHTPLHVYYLASILDWSALIEHITEQRSWEMVGENASRALNGAHFFFNDADEKTAAELESKLVLQWNTQPEISGHRWRSVRKTYIHCERDNAVPLDLGKRTAKDYDMDFVTFDGAHSYFSTRPEAFAGFIDGLIKRDQ